jgi:DNA-directed RNA polymerase subunit RPC12/RpoP
MEQGMTAKFGTKICSHCRRDFEPIRKDQHLCCRECHDQFFVEERRKALAAWRRNRRMLLEQKTEVA